MLESVFIMMIASGIAFFILGIEGKNIIYSAVSMLFWITTLAGHVFIQVPTDTNYYEPAIFAISLGMIIINVIWMIIQYSDFNYWKGRNLP